MMSGRAYPRGLTLEDAWGSIWSPNVPRTHRCARSTKTQADQNALRLAPAYRRATDLPRLLPLEASELADVTHDGRLRIIAALERALLAERRRGRTGHWSYQLGRHANLRRALDAENAALER